MERKPTGTGVLGQAGVQPGRSLLRSVYPNGNSPYDTPDWPMYVAVLLAGLGLNALLNWWSA